MKKYASLFFITLLFLSLTVNFVRVHHEEELIKEVIETGYIHGAFNELNPEAMAVSFHKDFAIFSPGKNGQISRYPIASWIESTKSAKSNPRFDPKNNVWDHKFSSVDVSGNSAAVKLELFRDGRQVYTDYLSLLKFDDQWKIVAKVYHEHKTP